MSPPAKRVRSTPSVANPRVSLITSVPAVPEPAKVEPLTPQKGVDGEKLNMAGSSSGHLVRRSTRTIVTSASNTSTSSKLNLSAYAYEGKAPGPVTPSPRKKPKLEHVSGTPLREIPSPDTGDSPKTPKSSKKPFPQLALDKPHAAPARWEEQYRLIERMRKGIVAPVDDMWVLFWH